MASKPGDSALPLVVMLRLWNNESLAQYPALDMSYPLETAEQLVTLFTTNGLPVVGGVRSAGRRVHNAPARARFKQGVAKGDSVTARRWHWQIVVYFLVCSNRTRERWGVHP